MTSKGQVTIPADIRKALGLVAGERVVFTQLDDGSTVMRAKTRLYRYNRARLKRRLLGRLPAMDHVMLLEQLQAQREAMN